MKEKLSSRLFVCLFFVYTSSIIARMSFSAVTVALVGEEVLTKTEAGLISSVFWLLYAVGQIFGGFLTKKISPYILIESTIVSSALTNLLLAFTKEFWIMLVIWGIGGILQFGMWPAILELISTEIVPKQRATVTGRLAFCYCLGSIVSYALTAVVLEFLSWRHVFIWCGVINAMVLVLALYGHKKLSPVLRQEEKTESFAVKSEKITKDMFWKSVLPSFCAFILILGFVETGIKSWMPTIMMETYGASPSYTSFLTVILLITNIFGVLICHYIYEKRQHDELGTLKVMYIMIVPMILCLMNFKGMSIYIATALMSGITVLMYGSKQIILMNYPARFYAWGLTAAVGGIINAFGALGNVLATYGSGFIADTFGWGELIVVWNVLIILFVLIVILSTPLWRKFRRRE